jgi:hypothetical protein
MSRAPGKYVAGAMVPADAALDRPAVTESPETLTWERKLLCPNEYISYIISLSMKNQHSLRVFPAEGRRGTFRIRSRSVKG